MQIGVPQETKTHEHRVGMTPASVREVVDHGHGVIVQRGLGASIGFGDEPYIKAGADLADDSSEIFARADMIVKVKEPQPVECRMLREGQVIFTYLHLAPDPEQARLLSESGAVAIAYETVTDARGNLPLLAPMSEVAGRMAIQVGAHCLEMKQGGRGTLLGGGAGVAGADVVILGGGTGGINAARMAMGLEARVTVIDRSLLRLHELDQQFGPTLNTIYATVDAIERYVVEADLMVGGVLVPGAAAPKILTREMIRSMRRGAVFVDVSIDQGGCSETTRATNHDDPTYVVDNVIHYCVTNMPGAVARTSTLALNNATLPFVLALADKGYRQALTDEPHLCEGLNVCKGHMTYEAVAHAIGVDYVPPIEALAA